MIYRRTSPCGLRPGDRIRRFGKVLTIERVTPVTDYGSYQVVFDSGASVSISGRISVIDEERTSLLLDGTDADHSVRTA